MTTTAAQTAGQSLTAALRRYFSIGPRTRRYRKSPFGSHLVDLHAEMIEAIEQAACYPGSFAPATNDALSGAYGVALSYEKHVGGYRIDGTLRYHISEMSPWQFSALLGQMVDAGVETTGAGERFFSEMARTVRIAA
jgi:hypothetical protein